MTVNWRWDAQTEKALNGAGGELRKNIVPKMQIGIRKLRTASPQQRRRWFGSQEGSVGSKLNVILAFTDRLDVDKSINFIKLQGRNLYGSVWPTVLTPGLGRRSVLTVGSSVEIRLQDSYFTSDVTEKVNTVFHELTHKLLDTDDALGYSPPDLLAVAAKDAAGALAALNSAENWTQFFAEVNAAGRGGGGSAGGSSASRPSPRMALRRCGG